jgi:hypothetical protein
MRPLGEGPLKKPTTHDETLRVLSGFANELCDAIAGARKEDRSRILHEVNQRFSGAMPFSEKQLQGVLEDSLAEMSELAAVLHVNLKQSPFAKQLTQWVKGGEEAHALHVDGLDDTVLGDRGMLAAEGPDSPERTRSGVPDGAQTTLAAGIQDISNSLVDDFALNDILRIILETMYRAMGFQRVLLCLKDPKTNSMTGRFGFGADTAEIAKRFRFSMAYLPDVFHVSLVKSVDVIITDIDDPKIADKIPVWYRQSMSAKTFVLFPLTIKGNPVALIYCDRERAGSIEIPERELTLLKTLRNPALLAIKQTI